MCAKNYENWLTVDKVIAKNYQAYFLAHPVCYLIVSQPPNLHWLGMRRSTHNTDNTILHSLL